MRRVTRSQSKKLAINPEEKDEVLPTSSTPTKRKLPSIQPSVEADEGVLNEAEEINDHKQSDEKSEDGSEHSSDEESEEGDADAFVFPFERFPSPADDEKDEDDANFEESSDELSSESSIPATPRKDKGKGRAVSLSPLPSPGLSPSSPPPITIASLKTSLAAQLDSLHTKKAALEKRVKDLLFDWTSLEIAITEEERLEEELIEDMKDMTDPEWMEQLEAYVEEAIRSGEMPEGFPDFLSVVPGREEDDEEEEGSSEEEGVEEEDSDEQTWSSDSDEGSQNEDNDEVVEAAGDEVEAEEGLPGSDDGNKEGAEEVAKVDKGKGRASPKEEEESGLDSESVASDEAPKAFQGEARAQQVQQ